MRPRALRSSIRSIRDPMMPRGSRRTPTHRLPCRSDARGRPHVRRSDFRHQRRGSRTARSPLRRPTLRRSIADDRPASPTLPELGRCPTQQLPVLLLASVHSIVLAEPDVELGRLVPDRRRARRRTRRPVPGVRPAVRERREPRSARSSPRVRPRPTRSGGARCSLPALGIDRGRGRPARRWLDVGTSAGLNLQLDRYALRVRRRAAPVGDPSTGDAPTAECRDGVPIPLAIPPIVGRRRASTARPIDVTDADSVRWLMACVWPDQHDRFERLRRGDRASLPSIRPTCVQRRRRSTSLGDRVERVGPHGHPVVINSWVLNYLAPERATRVRGRARPARARARPVVAVRSRARALAPDSPVPDVPSIARS